MSNQSILSRIQDLCESYSTGLLSTPLFLKEITAHTNALEQVSFQHMKSLHDILNRLETLHRFSNRDEDRKKKELATLADWLKNVPRS